MKRADPAELLGELVDEMLLVKAARAARKGDYATAQGLIRQVLAGGDESPRAFDLMARIHAQQGQFFEAESFWKRALQLDPNNESFVAGLQRISKRRTRTFALGFFRALLGPLCLAVILLVGGSVFWQRLNRWQASLLREMDRQHSVTLAQVQRALDESNQNTFTALANIRESLTEATAASARHGQAVLKQMENSLARMEQLTGTAVEAAKNFQAPVEATRVDPTASTEPQPFRPPVEIQLAGARCEREGEAVVVTFEEGLFLSGTALKPRAKALLDDLAEQLKPLASSLSIRVVGYTDAMPVRAGSIYRDNAHLGLARAVTVVDYLSRKGLPPTLFSAQSGGCLAGSSPNDSQAQRLSNRTVKFYISASKENDR